MMANHGRFVPKRAGHRDDLGRNLTADVLPSDKLESEKTLHSIGSSVRLLAPSRARPVAPEQGLPDETWTSSTLTSQASELLLAFSARMKRRASSRKPAWLSTNPLAATLYIGWKLAYESDSETERKRGTEWSWQHTVNPTRIRGSQDDAAAKMNEATGTPGLVLRAVCQRQRLGIPLGELQAVKTLGTGTFGRVKLVVHQETGRTFALKVLQKAHIVSQKQQANVLTERDIMFSLEHPFIVHLYDTFKDRDRLYMLMECVQGGELFSRLHGSLTTGRLPTGEARFYSACVLDALEYMHSRAVVFRDLKPENLLIDEQGYLKIVDFGFAKVVKDRTYTTCGTAEYLAPEIFLGRGHGRGVDYWALGILLYEQVAGYSPFADHDNNDPMIISKNIIRGKLTFPSGPHFIDAALKDVIRKLLVKDVSKRLGCMRVGAGDIKAHPFFRDIDWHALRAKRVPAPWRPKLVNPLDTSHFDAYDEDDSCRVHRDDGTNWDAAF